MEFLLKYSLEVFTTVFGGGSFLMYLIERKKNKLILKKTEAEVELLEIENSEKLVEMYKETLDDLEIRYKKKYTQMSEAYEREIKFLEDEIKIRQRRNNSLKREISVIRMRTKSKVKTRFA